MDMSQGFIDYTIDLVSGKMIPLMFVLFAVGVVFRFFLYYTIKREEWFTKEFEKRVENSSSEVADGQSFFYLTRKILEKTYYEIFELRSIMKRRKPDVIMTVTDRLFLVQQGTARFINDVLCRVKIVRYGNDKPDFEAVAKNSFERNACFGKILGIIPTTLVNDILVILPGIFIVMGILGTFLGIMKALPEIGNLDITNEAATKMVLDQFLVKIAFSMRTSIIGIIFSVALTVMNSIWGVEKIYVKAVERFVDSLDIIWNFSSSNTIHARETEEEINAGKSLDRELGVDDYENEFKRAA